jgi:hypothetical protein
MSSFLLISVVISVVIGVITFLASNNYIIAIIALVIYLLYFLIFARKIFNKYQTKIVRFYECYHFINTFIVSLSIKSSLSSAYETAILTIDKEHVKELETIDSFEINDWLNHLNKYFKFHIFSLFIDLININEEQGGNILEQSKYLLEELRLNEEYISEGTLISKRKMTEFAILWVLTYVIMVFMRFALSSFFQNISKQLFFIIGILLIDVFCLLSIHFAIIKYTSLKIKGWDDV